MTRLTVANCHTYRGPLARARYIGRPSVYGNPFRVGDPVNVVAGLDAHAACVELFRRYWHEPSQGWLRDHAIRFLDPHDVDVLLCWCTPGACHGDVIAQFVNTAYFVDATPA